MVDFFLKIDSVLGDSHDSHHKDEIEVIAFSWGETHAGSLSATGSGGGKVAIEDFHFTALIGVASPKLMLHVPMANMSRAQSFRVDGSVSPNRTISRSP